MKALDKEFPSLNRSISKIVEEVNKKNPLYVRTFSEIIKFIPLIGSWLERNTLGAIQDKMLEDRLHHLEIICQSALKEEDVKKLEQQFVKINIIFYKIIANNLELLFRTNQDILDELRIFFATQKAKDDDYEVHSDFRFIVLSGASAVGKDALLDRLQEYSSEKFRGIEVLTKLTTRPKRQTDHSYYKFLTKSEFQEYMDRDKVLFNYSKRQYNYGFDKFHLQNVCRSKKLLFAIFTEFEKLRLARNYLEKVGINVTTILLTAPEKDLIRRSWCRNLSDKDVRDRITSIRVDCSYIKRHKALINSTYDHIIRNGDWKSILGRVKKIGKIIDQL